MGEPRQRFVEGMQGILAHVEEQWRLNKEFNEIVLDTCDAFIDASCMRETPHGMHDVCRAAMRKEVLDV